MILSNPTLSKDLGQMTKLVDKTFDILAVGTSTGGPNALIDVLTRLMFRWKDPSERIIDMQIERPLTPVGG